MKRIDTVGTEHKLFSLPINLRIDLKKVFQHIDEYVFSQFETTSYGSADTLVQYELKEKSLEEDVVTTLLQRRIFINVSPADIYSLAKEEQDGKNVFRKDGCATFFFAKNKFGQSCQLAVVFLQGESHLKYYDLTNKALWPPGRRIFGQTLKK